MPLDCVPMGANLVHLPFSLCSESEDVEGNRVKEHYCFKEGGGNDEDTSWIYYDDMNLYSNKTKSLSDAIKMTN